MAKVKTSTLLCEAQETSRKKRWKGHKSGMGRRAEKCSLLHTENSLRLWTKAKPAGSGHTPAGALFRLGGFNKRVGVESWHSYSQDTLLTCTELSSRDEEKIVYDQNNSIHNHKCSDIGKH